MKHNRIDQLGAPPPQAPKPSKPMAPWVRSLLLSLAGASAAALCPFIPVPAVRAVCVAVSAVVSAVPAAIPQPPEEPSP